MAAVDIFLLLLLLASLLIGAWRGLVYEVLSLSAWVAAFFLAQWWAEEAAAWLPLAELDPPLPFALGFALVFVATVFVGGLLAWLIKKGVEQVGLRPIDRTLGAAFGLLRGVVILLALTLVLHLTPLHQHPAWEQSVGDAWLYAGLAALEGLMPAWLAAHFP
ncbi:MAG: CvpA family protein [Serpentinimonas sp.]|nr:MAG: colicin V synthesis protein [Comamonadaceae bacterium BICA1-1]MDO9611063.1 CvpA family protein [Serpentinimonas sp.]